MTTTHSSDNEMMESFKAFPFATDQEYQAGLQNILASDAFKNKTNTEKENTLRLSRIFYFNKITGNSITLEDALNFESPTDPIDSNRLTEKQPQQATEDEVWTLTFAELKELIEKGTTEGIPNNRLIPDILNGTPPSENTGQIRKKPWET